MKKDKISMTCRLCWLEKKGIFTTKSVQAMVNHLSRKHDFNCVQLFEFENGFDTVTRVIRISYL